MSREIPLDRPLTRADREYLEARGQYAMVARLDQNYPQENPDEQPVPFAGDQSVDLLVSENEALRRELEALRREKAEGQTPTTAPDALEAPEGEDLPPYAEWKKDDLIAEAGVRGLSKSGTVQELAARLEAYDAAQ